MSEKLHSQERMTPHIDASAESLKNLERIKEQAENETQQPNIEAIQKSIEQHAVASESLAPSLQEQATDSGPIGNQKQLKDQAYRRTLQRLRSRLNSPERAISRLIHQPIIESSSNALSKTVARPSGLLGGAVLALVGSSLVLLMAKHYGFTYNYMLFIWLFIIGFVVGIVIDVITLTVRRNRP